MIGDAMGTERAPAMRLGWCAVRLIVAILAGGAALAQTAGAQASADPAILAQHALALVEKGRCTEALPIFQRVMPRLTGKDLRYHAAMGQARCAMAREDAPTAVAALMQLRSEFPDHPEVLFVSVHYFSHLAMRISQELAAKAPTSFQARRLEAEAFESRGKWDEAAGLYRGILQENAKEHGVHYRLGQVLLSKAGDSGAVDEARAEFQKELDLDPHNSAAEFVLGELARRAGQWDEAARHFSRAAEVDAEFAEAYLALGMSLTSAAKFAEAVTPLETYVKMQPDDPLGHYQLALAYGRTGNREGAVREMALQRETAAKQPQAPGGAAGRVVR
jgi:tetratricopeptide (TPR) repeat protein